MLVLLINALASAAEPAPLVKTTHTYKTVADLPIQLDVHRPADDKARPVLVWIHGGALITGSKAAVPNNLLELARKEGYAVVSIDYRLAPETKAPAIVEDVLDAFRWIHGKGKEVAHLDPSRLVVAGGSAGGYLTLLTGYRVEPRPRALVAYWGYGDLDGDWYVKPSEYYRTAIPLLNREDVITAVSGPPLAAPRDSAHGTARGLYYRYLRQNGLWTKEVTSFDPVTDRAKLAPLCPVRNVTPKYPPTLLLHGDEDEDVPFDKSVDMAKQFEKHGVPHEFIRVEKGRHGLGGADKRRIEEAHARALAFIKSHLPK